GRPDHQATGSSPVRQVGAEAEQLRAMATARAADKAVRHAVHHLTERQAIVRETELLDTATKHGMGHITVTDVRQAI
ncbi:hypothetical protein GUG42_06285, partial [Xanthomonas citri pv. citri]|nr:hypothetical protein [Xanthomonas citri pv. citri]